MRKLRLRSLVLSVLLLMMAGTAGVLAQSVTGSISGIVADPKEALVAGATVSVKNLGTNAMYTAITDSDGRFRFPSLPAGTYEMKVDQRGFASYVRAGITLTLNQQAVIDVTMELAGTKEVVNVTADAGLANAIGQSR